MANSLEQLAQSIFKKSIEDCSEEELLTYSKRYPFFGPAQLLYLKKLDVESEAYQKQYQRAVLYYTDTTLFDYILDKETYETTFVWENPEPVIATEIQSGPAEKKLTDNKETLSNASKPLESQPAVENLFTFEPYHTVDYFASQGIKLSVEESSKDKFGKQLMSFTEWLKTMKRLPATQKNQIQGPAEKQVENMAAHSVQSAEIITEAMAEVWLHQGNKAKAAEIYRKLSLLNPSKSSYFAAKIEHLNDSN